MVSVGGGGGRREEGGGSSSRRTKVLQVNVGVNINFEQLRRLFEFHFFSSLNKRNEEETAGGQEVKVGLHGDESEEKTPLQAGGERLRPPGCCCCCHHTDTRF